MWLWAADTDYGPFAKVSYVSSGMYDWRFNGIQCNCEGVYLPMDEQCVVPRQEEATLTIHEKICLWIFCT